jgi:uncharacterized iron-regulated membrane protein
MKLAPRTFRIEWSLHAWTGVLSSLLLFVMFYCGIFALFHEELHEWEDPAVTAAHADRAGTPALSFDRLLAQLQAKVKIPHGATVGFSVHEGVPLVPVWMYDAASGLERDLMLDTRTGAVRDEHSRLAEELYVMHFFYRVPWGMQISGLISVALLVTLISGLLTHLKDLVRNWWVFRPRLRLRRSASDAHVALGILTMPFAVMIAWSGALLALLTLLAGGFAFAAYRGDALELARIRGEEALFRAPTNQPGTSLSLDDLAQRAHEAVPSSAATPTWFGVGLFGDENAFVRVYFPRTGLAPERHAYLQASDGKVLKSTHRLAAGVTFERTMTDLHYGNYGGVWLKALYTLLALGLCGIVITGNVIWLERRDPRRAHLGNRMLERLMAGVAPGLIQASAAYFVANRVLPAGMVGRADLEFAVFLGAWAFAVGLAFIPSWSARRASVTSCYGASVLFFSVVMLDLLGHPQAVERAWTFASPNVLTIELLLLGLGCACLGSAKIMGRGLNKAHVSVQAQPARAMSVPALEDPSS